MHSYIYTNKREVRNLAQCEVGRKQPTQLYLPGGWVKC